MVRPRSSDPLLALSLPPRLASWDAAANPSQIALGVYLDHVEDLLSDETGKSKLALNLEIGLPDATPLTTGGQDLDNYLLPVVHRLGWQRFESVFAAKRHGSSGVWIGPAMSAVVDLTGWSFASVTTTSSAESRAWKQEVAAVFPAVDTGEGPIEVHVSYVLSARRNWSSLWKPTIDALGGVLGVKDPARPFHPRDDRVIRLGLHRRTDEALGWQVHVGVWWRVTS